MRLYACRIERICFFLIRFMPFMISTNSIGGGVFGRCAFLKRRISVTMEMPTMISIQDELEQTRLCYT